MKFWKFITPDIAFLLVGFATVAIMGSLLFNAVYRNTGKYENLSNVVNVCQTSGYADHIKINSHDYCYRLEGDGGQLILVDSLEDKND